MRRLDTIANDADTQRFSAFLHARKIGHHIEAAEAGTSGRDIWILHDDDMPEATAWLERFRADPQAEAFTTALAEATEKAARARRALEAIRKKRPRPAGTRPMHAASSFPLAFVLIGLALVVTAYTRFGTHPSTQEFLLTRYELSEGMIRYSTALPEIRRGEIWRLFTPMFLHFNFLHLLFNIWWLRDLGTAVERAAGRRTLLILTVTIAVLSHLAQFTLSGPRFGGLSGLVFGLLGYAWVRGKYDLTCGLFVPTQIVAVMGIWFALGFTGMIGPIANMVHAGGLIIGLIYGYIAAQRATR